jgi:hypothetical protein
VFHPREPVALDPRTLVRVPPVPFPKVTGGIFFGVGDLVVNAIRPTTSSSTVERARISFVEGERRRGDLRIVGIALVAPTIRIDRTGSIDASPVAG